MTWLQHLRPLFQKQADNEDIVPPSTPMREEAPNYKLADDSRYTCDSCGFNDKQTNYCQKYSFHNNPSYVCDSYQPLDLNLNKLSSLDSQRLPHLPGHINKSANQSGIPELQPINVPGGNRGPKPGQVKQPTGIPNMNQPQPQANINNSNWKPSVVSQVARDKGDPQAWLYDLFKPKQASVLSGSLLGGLGGAGLGSLIHLLRSGNPMQTGSDIMAGGKPLEQQLMHAGIGTAAGAGLGGLIGAYTDRKKKKQPQTASEIEKELDKEGYAAELGKWAAIKYRHKDNFENSWHMKERNK